MTAKSRATKTRVMWEDMLAYRRRGPGYRDDPRSEKLLGWIMVLELHELIRGDMHPSVREHLLTNIIHAIGRGDKVWPLYADGIRRGR